MSSGQVQSEPPHRGLVASSLRNAPPECVIVIRQLGSEVINLKYPGVLWLTEQSDQRHHGVVELDGDRVRIYISNQIVADWHRSDVVFTGAGSRYGVSSGGDSLVFEPEPGSAFGSAAFSGGLAGRIAQVTQSGQVPTVARSQPAQMLPQAAVQERKKRRWPWVLGALILIGMIGNAGAEDGLPVATTIRTTTPSVAHTATTTRTPTTTTAITTTQPPLTRSEENAVQSAESYLDYTAFSRSGLIEQLVYEGFTIAEATLAVDYLNVDWNEQAWKSAESYLDYTAFSRSGLIEQLVYEGFTIAEATLAVDYLKVDWNEQAWKSAESYLDYTAFSRSGLIEQLVYEGFSTEQATYGVDKAGL